MTALLFFERSVRSSRICARRPPIRCAARANSLRAASLPEEEPLGSGNLPRAAYGANKYSVYTGYVLVGLGDGIFMIWADCK
jgi:hypothetical protein